MKKRHVAVLLPAIACAAFAAPAAAATSTSEAVSENWAGYEATTQTGSGFSAASGSWIEPKVDCSAGQSYSAYWVGLGGGGQSSSALEQEGTQANCSSTGQASYYAWYELVPAAPVKIPVAVKPGDKIYGRTSVDGSQVTVELDNQTTGQSYSKTLTMANPAPDTTTAEWIAEAPSACQGGATGQCTPLPLSNFGSVRFSSAYARSNGTVRSISGWDAQPIALSPAASASSATPGGLAGDGTAFTVAYGGATSTAADTGTWPGYGYGYGYGDGGYIVVPDWAPNPGWYAY